MSRARSAERARRWRHLAPVVFFPLAACGGGTAAPAPSAPPPAGPPGVSDYFPLEDRTTLSFVTKDDLGGSSFFVMEIERPTESRADIWIAGRRTRYSIEPRRIGRIEGGLLLEEPLEVGHTFPGPFGTTRITSTTEQVTVPAGTFENCLVTVEEATSPPKRAETTFCLKVGVVRVVITGASEADVTRVQSELTAYGPRVDFSQPVPNEGEPSP